MDDRWSRISSTNNQVWWESLSGVGERRFGRSASSKNTVKLYAMTCGWLSADIGMMLGRAEGHIHFPIPAYLIEHPKGCVLFDTGMHPDCQHDPHQRLGEMANDLVKK